MAIDILEDIQASPTPSGGVDILADVGWEDKPTPPTSTMPKSEKGKSAAMTQMLTRTSEYAENAGKSLFLGMLESAAGLGQKVFNTGVGNIIAPHGQLMWDKGGAQQQVDTTMQSLKSDYDQMPAGQGLGAIRAAGNVAGMLPLNPAIKAAGALPGLASTIAGKAALTPVAGAAQGAMAGGSMYDYSDPNSKLNVPGAIAGGVGGAITAPAVAAGAGLLGAAGRGVSKFLNKQQRPDEAAQQAYMGIVGKISKDIAKQPDMYAMEKAAAGHVQQVSKNLSEQANKMWRNQVLGQDAAKPAAAGVVEKIANNFDDFLNTHKDSIKGGVPLSIKRMTPSKDLTFEQLKNLRTDFWKKVVSPLKKENIEAYQDAYNIYNNISMGLKETAVKYGKLQQFDKASVITKNIKNWEDDMGVKVADLATKQGVANKFIKDFFSVKSGAETARRLGNVDPITADMMSAKALRELATKSTKVDGVFDINKFLQTLNTDPRYQAIVQNSKQVRVLSEFVDVLKAHKEAGSLNIPTSVKQTPIVGMAAEALNYLTKPSSAGLKDALSYAGLSARNPTVKKYFQDKAAEQLIKAGVSINNGIVTMSPPKERNK